MKMRKQNKKGISLIVLVITIIVMIILAAAIVITLNNSGIIGKANEAVELTNLKQVQQMASVLWSEAYVNANGNITKDELYDAIIQGLEDSNVDTTKYTINVTTTGVEVSLKGDEGNSGDSGESEPELNKHGFYFDRLYVSPATESAAREALIIHGDGSGEYYSALIENDNTMYCTEYFESGIVFSENKATVTIGTQTVNAEFTNNGNNASFMGRAFAVTNEEVHGIYKDQNYCLYIASAGADMYFILNSDNTAEAGVVGDDSETITITVNGVYAKDHILDTTYVSGDETLNNYIYVSTDGKHIYLRGEKFTLEEPEIDIPDGTEVTHSGTIPTGGKYYVGVTGTTLKDYTGATATYTAGDAFPATPTIGDVYVYGDYEYRYNKMYMATQEEPWQDIPSWISLGVTTLTEGWGVRALNTTKSSYGGIIPTINNEPITALVATFYGCSNLTSIPSIPTTATTLQAIFKNCSKLSTTPTIHEGVRGLSSAFAGTAIETMPTIPEGVTDLSYAFENCTSLKNVTAIPSTVTSMWGTFIGCTSLTTAPDLSKATKLDNVAMAFYNCTSLAGTITLNADPTSYGSCLYNTKITAVNGTTTLASTILASKTDP